MAVASRLRNMPRRPVDSSRLWPGGAKNHPRPAHAAYSVNRCSRDRPIASGLGAMWAPVKTPVRWLYPEQKLSSRFEPLQCWQRHTRTPEDETALELTPGAMLSKAFTFHNKICHQT